MNKVINCQKQLAMSGEPLIDDVHNYCDEKLFTSHFFVQIYRLK